MIHYLALRIGISKIFKIDYQQAKVE